MEYSGIFNELLYNKDVFRDLLTGAPQKMYVWKQSPEKWCLLEIVCHLYDEEREDFRARTKQILETPSIHLTPIDPQGWVVSRKYMEQDYQEMLNKFLVERDQSITWLRNLEAPDWNSSYHHEKFGPMSAKFLLANWLAHDYLHFRQITKLKYDYLKHTTGEDIGYAGNW